MLSKIKAVKLKAPAISAPKISKEAIFSPLGIFIMYILAAGLAIMGFRFIFPGETAPLPYFSLSWRLTRGLLDFLNLFPALALSAIIIPFGFKIRPKEKINPFSPQFLQSLKMSIITAIVAAALYALLFSLALPLVKDHEADLRSQGRLFHLAREQAQQHAIRGEWAQTAQFLAICERIWPGGHQVAALAAETQMRLQEMQRAAAPLFDAMTYPALPGQRPLNVTEAIALAETALAAERYFDAHWLATVGARLATPGSPEMTTARRIASIAWDGVNSLAPNAQETLAFNLFRLKREGFEALNSEEWIRAYYIFLELMERTPQDPDVHRFFAMSLEGLRHVAFFIDEMDMALGNILTGAVFSLPMDWGRVVMRFSSISMFPDSAYCMDAEIFAFDPSGQPLWSMKAPYAKIVPLVLHSGPRLSVMLRALDRADETLRWEPITESFGQSAPDSAQVAIPVSWDDFVLISNVRRGLPMLSVAELRMAAENLGSLGYLPEVFQVELLRRFAEPSLMLLLGILAITLGWRFRALKHTRIMGVLMLGIMPLVLNGAVNFFRGWIANLGIWAVVSLGFTPAAFIFAASITVLFVLFLIILASQHA